MPPVTLIAPLRPFTTSPPLFISFPPTRHLHLHRPFSTIPTCPSPTCACAPTPEGLAIDRSRQLIGTMPPYRRHVVIRTGVEDWSGRIEQERSEAGALVRGLKGWVGKGGRAFDPNNPILITLCSAPAQYPPTLGIEVFPQNVQVRRIANTPEFHEAVVRQFLGSKLEFRRELQRQKAVRERFFFDETGFPLPEVPLGVPHLNYAMLTAPTILICGHNSRDTRCGILGPLLMNEFGQRVGAVVRMMGRERIGANVSKVTYGDMHHPLYRTKVALTSHIGGHAFAGNVVIYIPKRFKLEDGKFSPLAGKGIWYGRVEPMHVEGIIEQTLLRGRVIEELLRGVHEP